MQQAPGEPNPCFSTPVVVARMIQIATSNGGHLKDILKRFPTSESPALLPRGSFGTQSLTYFGESQIGPEVESTGCRVWAS